MYEFEDSVALMSIVGKVIKPNNCPMPPRVQDSYKYLLDTQLATPFDMARLRERVSDIYRDIMMEYQEEPGYIPDAYELADFVNEENMETIRDFYQEYLYNVDEVEDIIGNYIHNIGYGMEDWVIEILTSDGMPFSRGLSEVFSRPSKKELDEKYAPQNIMFYEMLY